MNLYKELITNMKHRNPLIVKRVVTTIVKNNKLAITRTLSRKVAVTNYLFLANHLCDLLEGKFSNAKYLLYTTYITSTNCYQSGNVLILQGPEVNLDTHTLIEELYSNLSA